MGGAAGRARISQEVEHLAARFEGELLPGGSSPAILLFDRPRLAVSCAFAVHATARELNGGCQAALHLGEVHLVETLSGAEREVELSARATLDRLLRLALDGQTLVSAVIEGMLRYSSFSGSAAEAEEPESVRWRWRHHGRYRFEDDEEPIDVIEVSDDEKSVFLPPREPEGVSKVMPSAEPGVQLRPGESLLRYRILDVLGRGGMGVVYRAEDGRLRRQVALKTLPRHLAQDREHLLRFEREVQAIAAVNHPNIVTIHNVEDDGEIRFLTMELVEGQPLSELVTEDGLSLQLLLDLAIPLADALAAAHAHGVVHRDLKPGNVMVTREGRVKVLDFGLAKLRDEGVETVTHVGQMVGTLAYMSPEQLGGGEAGPRADLFSFAVILYQLATGRRPFSGSGAALMYSIIHHAAPSLAERRPDLPEALGSLIEVCLAKDPRERRTSAKRVRDELLDIRRHAGLDGGLSTGAWRVHRPRHRLLMAWVAGLAVIAVSGVLLWRTFSRPSAEPPPALAQPRLMVLPCHNQGAPEDDFFADGLSAEITSRLAAEEHLEIISYATSLRYARTEKSLRDIGQELRASHLGRCTVTWARELDPPRVRLLFEVVQTSDEGLLFSKTFDQELGNIFDLQTQIARQVVGELGFTFEHTPRLERPTSDSPAYLAYLRGRRLASSPEYTPEVRLRVIEHFEEATARDPDFLLAWAELAKAHALYFQLRHDLSAERAGLARQASQRALELDDSSPEARLADGLVHYWTERDYAAALEDFEYAEKHLPNSWEVYASMAWVLRRQGQGETAWLLLERALRLNPRDPALTTNAGITATWLRRYAEARPLFEVSIAEAPNRPMAFWLDALTYWLWTGRTDVARRALEGMPERDERVHWFWFRQLYYERRPAAARRRLERVEPRWIELSDFSCPVSLPEAMTWQLEGETGKAAGAWRRALRELREVEDHPARVNDPRYWSAVGVAQAAVGDRDAALEAARRALGIRPMSLDAYEGPAYLEHLAWMHVLLGDSEEAIEQLAQLLAMPSRVSVPLLRLDPKWDPLRENPRFEAMLARFE